MIICEACEKRKEWLKKWATIAAERARHLWSKPNEQDKANNRTTIRLDKRVKRTHGGTDATNPSDQSINTGRIKRAGRAADV